MRKIIFTSVLLLIEFIVIAQKKNRPADQLYLTQLKGAEAYYRLNQIGEAKKILQEVPSAKRGWEWQLLHARMDRSVQTLRGHNKSVAGIAVSTDGKYLATGSADSSIIIWDADNYLPVKQITGHKGQVTTLSFSPDGKTLLSGSTDKTLRLWNITEGKEIRNYNTEFRQGIYQSVFSADGKNIAACSWELSNGVVGFAKVIDVMTGKLVRRFDTDDHPASAIKFSADGNKLFSGTWGFHIKQHDIATGQTDWDYDLNQFNYYTAVQSIDVSSDGKHVI
ncbi:MAG TPA: hypothetical protein VI461_02350, partial [Chitinophagaceae bacterium]|nr:hypothetical protein [Chitinophagaceae bacterium]